MPDADDELTELRRRLASLEEENASLRARLGAAAGEAARGGRPPRRAHNFWANVVFVVATILVPVAVIATFVKSQVTDTGRYVDTVAPLASDPAIQSYVADRVTTRLFQQVDIEQYVSDALPPKAQRLTGPIASGLESFTREATARILESDQFQKVWTEGNRVAHAQMVKLLTGKGGNVTVARGGAVEVDLSGVVDQVKQRMSDRGVDLFEKIPTEKLGGEITVFRSEGLYRARRAVGVLETLAIVLPILTVALFALAIWLSASRRRGFVKAAIGLTLGVAFLAVALTVGRNLYLNTAVDGGIPETAAAAVWDTLLRFLRTSIRDLLLVGIVIVLAVFFAGPSRLSVAFRRGVDGAVDWVGGEADRAGWRVLGANDVVRRYRPALRIVVVVLAVVVLVVWSYPTPKVILVAVILALLGLVLVELFGRPGGGGPAEVGPGGATPASTAG